MARAALLLFCIISSVTSGFSSVVVPPTLPQGVQPFLKQNNSYIRVLEKESPELPINDYVPTITKLLENAKSGVPVTAGDLNKFSHGISQYYLSRAYEYYYAEVRPIVPVVNISDPIYLPDVNVTGKKDPDICFYDAKVYGYPPFKPNYQVISALNSSPHFQDFVVTFKAPADTVIFTGTFSVYEKPYFFTYLALSNEYQSTHLKVRNNAGIIQSKTTTDSFSYLTDRLAHSYDSFLEHYSEVNEQLNTQFVSTMEKVYLPYMSVSADSIVSEKFAASNNKFTEMHRQKILDLLIQAAKQYGSLKGFNVFNSSPLIFTNLEAKAHNRTAILTYDRITVEGLLNFVNYDISTPVRTTINSSHVHFSDKITFYYSQSDDLSNATCFSFRFKLRLKDAIKRYRVQSLTVETAFIANVNKSPPELTRNLEAFETPTGFSFNLDVDTLDEPFYFLVKHASKELTRNIDATVFGTKYADY